MASAVLYILYPGAELQIQCCYITVDFVTAASQNGVSIAYVSYNDLVLRLVYNIDEINKNTNVFLLFLDYNGFSRFCIYLLLTAKSVL